MKKYMIAWCLLCMSILNITSAEDCNIFNGSWTQKQKNESRLQLLGETPITELNIVPREALHTAFANLNAYCCASNLSDKWWCDKEGMLWKQRNNYPQSAFFFDHLIDVMMRRRSNQLSGYNDIPADEQAKQRNEKINKLIINAEWALPTEFSKDYDSYRALQTERHLPRYHQGLHIDTFTKLFNADSPQNSLKAFKNRTLRTKYQNTCTIATYLTMKLIPENDQTTALTNIQESCKNLTMQTLEHQNQFLLGSIIYKSNQLTTKTLREYGIDYFTERLNMLQNKINSFNAKLLSSTRQISSLTPRCN